MIYTLTFDRLRLADTRGTLENTWETRLSDLVPGFNPQFYFLRGLSIGLESVTHSVLMAHIYLSRGISDASVPNQSAAASVDPDGLSGTVLQAFVPVATIPPVFRFHIEVAHLRRRINRRWSRADAWRLSPSNNIYLRTRVHIPFPQTVLIEAYIHGTVELEVA